MDYVYLWADGIHVNIRLEEHKLCVLVMVGVRADGRKELVALADGYRESMGFVGGSAAGLPPAGHGRAGAGHRGRGVGVLGCVTRRLAAGTRAAVLVHKIANVLAALPKTAHPGAKKALAEIWNAEDRRQRRRPSPAGV